jgi:hypothetical protein
MLPEELGGSPVDLEAKKETLEATWWIEKADHGFDDVLTQAGDSLQAMFDRYKAQPLEIDGEKVLYLQRFEMPIYDQGFQYSEAKLDQPDVVAFADFLSGFPMGNPEMLALVGESSSKKDKDAGQVPVLSSDQDPTPPFPKDLFTGYDEAKTLLNYFYLDSDYAQTMADGLKGEPEPKGLHWWVRFNFKKSDKFPVPGEFLALAPRLMVDKPWGEQKSSPFLFSGNWMDMVFYSTGKVTAIQDPTADTPYPVYSITWRNQQIQAINPSDFAEYQVGDRVAILKDVTTDKKTQLWKDDDMKNFGQGWMIAPVSFYGLDAKED